MIKNIHIKFNNVNAYLVFNFKYATPCPCTLYNEHNNRQWTMVDNGGQWWTMNNVGRWTRMDKEQGWTNDKDGQWKMVNNVK